MGEVLANSGPRLPDNRERRRVFRRARFVAEFAVDRTIECFKSGVQLGIRTQPPAPPSRGIAARRHGRRSPQVVEDIRADRRKDLARLPDGEIEGPLGQPGWRGVDQKAAAHPQMIVPLDHGIKRSRIAEIIHVGRRRPRRMKGQVMGRNTLGRPGRGRQTRFNVSLAGRFVIAVIGRVQNLETHQSRRIWWLMNPSAMTS